MSIRSVDIMRSQETTQVKQVEYSKMQNEQAQIERQFQSHLQQKGQRPNDVTESDNPEFKYDAKEKGSNSYKQNKGKEKKKKDTKDSKRSIEPGRFDVSI